MKTNLDSIFKANKDSEKEGVWLELKPDVGFLVKRFGGSNAHAIKAILARLTKPYMHQIQLGTLDAETDRKITVRAFVEACVIDWKGIEIDGKLEHFDREKCIEFFLHLPDCFDVIYAQAQSQKNYLAEDLGNS